MEKIYLYELSHEYEIEKSGNIYDIITDIGIYTTEEKAEKAVERLKQHPKFKAHPEGFEIGKTEVDHDYWEEGFDIWDKNMI